MYLTKKTVTSTDGIEIHYVKIDSKVADANQETIVLLHGLGGNFSVWKSQIEALSGLGYRVFAVDLRGHGMSGRPENKSGYELEKFLTDLELIFEKEQLQDVNLVGHCLGGMVTLLFAEKQSKYLKKLILINTSYQPALSLRIRIGRLTKKLLNSFLLLMARFSPVWHLEPLEDYSKFFGTADFDFRRILSDMAHVSLKSYFYVASTAFSFDAENSLSSIEVPTLIIAGKRDRLFPPSMAQYMEQHIKGSKLIVMEQGIHTSVMNHPQEITSHIHRYLGF